MKKVEKYFSRHIYQNSFFHVMVGIGFGILLTHDFFDPHPLRYGVGFLLIGALGHVFAYTNKK